MSATKAVSSWISFAALVAASTAAVAAGPGAATERTRNDVVAETLAARAAGTLAPAGEAATPRAVAAAPSSLARSAVEAQVREARAAGDLVPAGEGVVLASSGSRSVSLVTRAEIKATVIAARKTGDLVPAGEGLDAETHAHAQHVATVRTAGADGVTETMAKR